MTSEKKCVVDEMTASRIASLFESLSNPTRVRIISSLLDGEVNVGDLVQLIGLSKSAISHQLRGLRDKRVIRSRKQGRQVYISLDDEHISEMFQRGLDHVCHE
ncbi:MAG: winged helix-turn-helix transcriptional regulator [Anaerolineae bacterium]|nr:winged helix-turn-helix transcriptional regulator [Anaerolineae bacterium]BCY16645.1 transcriptional regulator [Leptolinea sp. HRD-7]